MRMRMHVPGTFIGAHHKQMEENYIERVFEETEDALDTISSVQDEARVRVSSMQPALPILDLHGITRAEIHDSLFRKMRDKLLGRVDELDSKGLTKLLDRCFRHISSKELRGVCLQIMQKLPQLDEKYLLHISDNPELYQVCPIEVKRQIWQTNQGFFGEAVSPLLDQYIAEKESILFSTHDSGEKKAMSFLSLAPKTRRQSPVMQELVHMVSSSQELYNTLLQFLRTLYLRTQVSHYCTLRADILMSLHEVDSSGKLCEADPCHKFAWCLDACIRAGCMDEKKSRELYSFLEGIGSGNEALGDVAMLLRDPYALHAVCTSILKCLVQLYENYKLPRESSELECLLRLLQLGTSAHAIMESEAYHESALDVELIIKFLPELLSIMSENTLRAIAHKRKEEYRPFTPSQHFINSLSNPCAMHIACAYSLHLLGKKELKSFSLILPLIAKGYTRSDNAQLPDIFLHLLVVRLLEHPDTIRELTMETILRDFWVVCALSSETALLHLCHLLWGLHPKINPRLLEDILDEIKPGEGQSDVAHQQYRTLMEHIENS